MAIDFLIFGLLLISFAANLLALGAFWVTPGLRTTANRFTINLLIINLIGCLILAPTLFLSSASSGDAALFNSSVSSLATSMEASENRDDSVEYYLKPGNHQLTFRHNGHLVKKEGIILQQRNRSASSVAASTEPRTIETIFKCNSTFYQQVTIDEDSHTVVFTEIEEEQQLQPSANASYFTPHNTRPPVVLRCWSIDMASALGALAVLLVVGDTWCAVTDPLRYHSRISAVRAWVLIALTWALGIFVGALSAFRELNFESETVLSKQKHYATDATGGAAQLQHSSESAVLLWTSTSSIFSMVFACIYFAVIILLPFSLVCGMYWRIFSEARENGLRMRQNGSSPLLQSAMNLVPQQQQQQLHQQPSSYTSSPCTHRNSLTSASSLGGGLQMCIDHQQRGSAACLRRDSAAKVLPTISDDGCSDEADADSMHGQQVSVAEQPDHNQNILLTLQTASGEIKRNYSTRHMPLLGTSSQERSENQRLDGIRQVHSSPNLQKYAQLRRDSLSGGNIDAQLLGAAYAMRPYSHPPLRSQLYHQHNYHMRDNHVDSHHMLRIPSINASPKAFSYMSSLRHRLSNASSLFKYREESRAARISILVVIMFLVSYLPYGFLVLLQSQLSAANCVYSTQLAIFMLLLGNLSSAFIFAYRNKRVRRGVKRLFGLNANACDRQLQHHTHSSARSSGFLQRYSGNKSGAGINRTGSKVSTYSANSCKLLTPQSSLGSNNNNNKNSSSFPELSQANNNNEAYIIASTLDEKSATGRITCSMPPILQRGKTTVDQMRLPKDTPTEKRNVFQKLRQCSKRLRYASQSCAQAESAHEPAPV